MPVHHADGGGFLVIVEALRRTESAFAQAQRSANGLTEGQSERQSKGSANSRLPLSVVLRRGVVANDCDQHVPVISAVDMTMNPVAIMGKTGLRLQRFQSNCVLLVALLISLLVLPILSSAATRAQAVRPMEDALWSRWARLPAEYQSQKRQALEQYLTLLSRTNAAAFNDQWEAFVSTMGPTFAPLRHEVIEAMKISEAFEAGFPSPEQRLPAMADALLDRMPTNAMFFTEADLLETVIVLRQHDNRRRDVLVFNSTRILDADYLQMALDRAGQHGSPPAKDLVKAVMQETLRRRQANDESLRDLEISDGQLRAPGVLLLTTMNKLMMKELLTAFPGRPGVLLPVVRAGVPISCWTNLDAAGLCFVVEGPVDGKRDALAEWQSVINAAAPPGQALHTEMAKVIRSAIEASAAILEAHGLAEVSSNLRQWWENRVQEIELVPSRDIRIDATGHMFRKHTTNGVVPR
jgi:hypothetical protein